MEAGGDKPCAEGWETIFDGTSLDGWKMCGPGKFVQEDGAIYTTGGMGMLWYAPKTYKDFIVKVEWKVTNASNNAGVFVRFPDPGNDPWVAVNKGHEIQIQDDRDPSHRTGAIYGFAESTKLASKPAGEWNTFCIRVVGQQYTVMLNGEKVCEFKTDRDTMEGHIGLQNHDDGSKVYFRKVSVKPL
jgi:hypothetical protein